MNDIEATTGCVTLLAMSLVGAPALADSWAAAGPFEVRSKNGRYVARIVPASKRSKPHVAVYRARGSSHTPKAESDGKRVLLWRAELTNTVCPVEAHLSDDAEHVVTLDNCRAIGYGNDVLAFYGPGGQIQRYSLSAALSMDWWQMRKAFREAHPGATDWWTLRKPSLGAMPQPKWPRDWNAKGVRFFDRFRSVLYFCMWLDWSNRWYAWTASDGRQPEIDDRLQRRWSRLARQLALHRLTDDRWAPACYEFLAIRRNPADRSIIERLLASNTFDASLQTRPSDGKSGTARLPEVSIESATRRTGDRLLGIHDGKRRRWAGAHPERVYSYLGSLRGTIAFPPLPSRGVGYLWIQLTSESRRGSAVEAPPGGHTARFDFRSCPGLWEWLDEEANGELHFGFYGVSPGEYRIRCVWDRARPFNGEHCATVLSKAGDYTNRDMPRVTIKAGEVTTDVLVDCTSPADDTRQATQD